MTHWVSKKNIAEPVGMDVAQLQHCTPRSRREGAAAAV
jgi:hypothetical protein